MRLELTRVGLLAELANHYTTRGAFMQIIVDINYNMFFMNGKEEETILLTAFCETLLKGLYRFFSLM